jgi:hypothetical protein
MHQAFLFVWLNFQLDKSELGERKREVIPTQRHSSFLGHSLIGAHQIGMETGMLYHIQKWPKTRANILS